MSVAEEVFKRQQLFNVRDANIKNKGYFTKHWKTKFKEWADEGLVEFDEGYWLTDLGDKYLSAV